MANNSPLNIGTDAAGGYLFEEQYGQQFIDGIRREAAVASLARVDSLAGKRQLYTVYGGRPTVSFVDEGAEKPVTGAEFSQLTLNVKKLAAIVVYSQELIEDAQSDPRVLINQDLAAAFAQKIDAHCLGFEAGSAITGSFDSEIGASTATTELGSGGDAIATSVSVAMEKVEAAGYTPNGIILASDAKAALRDARQTVETAQPVYTPGYTMAPDNLYGVNISYSSNLDGYPAGAGKVLGVVGDFSNAVLGIRTDLTARISDSATVNIGGTQHNLWQRNEVAVLWETRVGFVAHDVNNSFAIITNAS
jgi:HK97 family phage major capsid protein